MLLNLVKHRLIKDARIVYGVQISSYVLPLVALPYLTRVLGPANFGSTAVGTALVLYFVVIVELGFAVTGPPPERAARRPPCWQPGSRLFSGTEHVLETK